MDGGHKEGRQFPRVKVSIDGYYSIEGLDTRSPCEFIDISEVGACFLSREQLDKGEKIKVHFQLGFDAFYLKAIVLRIVSREIGVQFIDLSSEERTLLQDYVYIRLYKHRK